MKIAAVRQRVLEIDGVSRAWFELDLRNDRSWKRTLVVEVDFDTDPDGLKYRDIEVIGPKILEALPEWGTAVHDIRIVPTDPLK